MQKRLLAIPLLLTFGAILAAAQSDPAKTTPPQQNQQTPDTTAKPQPKDDPNAFPEDISRAAEAKAKAEQGIIEGKPADDSGPPVMRRRPDKTADKKDQNPVNDSEESSSRATKLEDPDVSGGSTSSHGAGDDVHEMHKFDPHRAENDLEVAGLYMKNKNYKGAQMRLEDALIFKPGDIVATKMLGELFEQTQRYTQARDLYENYIQAYPRGPFVDKAQAGLARVKKKLGE